LNSIDITFVAAEAVVGLRRSTKARVDFLAVQLTNAGWYHRRIAVANPFVGAVNCMRQELGSRLEALVFLFADPTRLVLQHHGDPVADRIRQAR
jgi:hypothetical protein